jgi:2-dehydro-3-deoxygalactonokinase
MHSPPALLGIDWGTSNRRAWWLAADGSVLAEHSDDQGLLAAQGRFAPALDALLARGPALPRGAPVLMSGMVGSASGWREAPYLAATQPLRSLAQQVVPVVHADRRCLIVPGVCFDGDDGTVDVMRGEETQLLGALAAGHGDGWYVLPGTHSKWVRLAQGRVAHLSTYMTGELFALLTQHGTLAAITRDGGDDPAAFARGLEAARGSGLSHALFGCRARVVAGRMPANEAREYLSGLLIGAEWADVQHRAGGAPERIRVIGSPALERRYADCGAHFGCRVEALDAAALQVAAFMVLAQSLAGAAP